MTATKPLFALCACPQYISKETEKLQACQTTRHCFSEKCQWRLSGVVLHGYYQAQVQAKIRQTYAEITRLHDQIRALHYIGRMCIAPIPPCDFELERVLRKTLQEGDFLRKALTQYGINLEEGRKQ